MLINNLKLIKQVKSLQSIAFKSKKKAQQLKENWASQKIYLTEISPPFYLDSLYYKILLPLFHSQYKIKIINENIINENHR